MSNRQHKTCTNFCADSPQNNPSGARKTTMSNNGKPQSKRTARPAWLNVAILLGLIVVFFLMRGRFDENNPAEETVTESAITESSESQTSADDSASTENASAAAEGASEAEGDSESASGEDAAADSAADSATEARAGPPGLPVITEDELPPEALETIALIESDGPYPYSKDGSTFQNREGILPDKPMGYYSEYTVETPGSPDRGARRIVGGTDGELYYTDDHYDSFSWIILE
jgi:ribonuclease T1